MPIAWRNRSSRPFWHSERPFPRLVRHFLVRLVRSDQDAASSEMQLGTGALLGMLAMPGAMASFLMLDKYSTFLGWLRGRLGQNVFIVSIPDKYLFLAMAMAITGIVTVLKWDKILPDAQDYLNLAPLPIRPRTVLAANAAAIAIAVLAFAIDVNAIPAVFFPLFVSAGGELTGPAFVRFAGIHMLCMMSASIFTFAAVFALLGAISAILPREAFRVVSSWLRGLILVGFLMLLVSGLAGPGSLLRHLNADPHSPARFLPSLWFLGLYQVLQIRSQPVLVMLARDVLPGSFAVLGLALVSYGISYRRRFASALEGGRRPSDRRASALLVWFLDLFGSGANGFIRAAHRFTVRALLRNESHRLSVCVAMGVGWLAAWNSGSLAASFSAAYVLILGLRFAFEIPAAAPAAWVYRAVLDPREHETLPVARRVMFAFLTPIVLLPALALAWWNAGVATACLHTAYLGALCLCASELQLAGYRKIPLTCPTPGFRDHLLMLCLLQFLGYEFFTRGGFAVEQWMLGAPWRFLLVPLAMAGAWYWNRQRLAQAREDGELEEGLTFDNVQVPAVERLNL
ncbi:MAG TPA: hypothetical protein VMB03_17830 [Bryobacteraceae bacterium]|nr:hypothetical protein [Bryobacteraceae bacterium]